MTNLFQDLWGGWVGFWKDVAATPLGRPQKPQTVKPPKKLKIAPPPVAPPKTLGKPPLVPKPTKKPTKKERSQELEVEGETVDPPAPFPKVQEQHLETPAERMLRMQKVAQRRTDPRSKPRRQLLWMNPGTENLRIAHQAFLKGLDLPSWVVPLQGAMTYDDDRLYFEGLPMLDKEEKRELIKREYFSPKGFSTIQPIYDKLQAENANLTRSDVRRVLRSLETYQLNFQRRHPPKIMSRMNLRNPGCIMLDMFFPSKNDGWRADLAGVLTCMDAWSRFVRCYAMERKTKVLVQKGIERFLQEFASKGHIPKMILCDKGSELKGAAGAIERYRTKPGPMVFHSQTGKPVNLVEQTQAQIQRRMAVFRTSGITDDYSLILDDITDSINNQKRPGRGNKTPLELLKLDKAGRNEVNANNRFGVATPDERFKDLRPGDKVRVLMMTIKEQVTNKKKGFTEKWSRDVYKVRRKQALQGNPGAFRYFVWNDTESYFRHELLKIYSVDQEVYQMVSGRENVIAEDWSP